MQTRFVYTLSNPQTQELFYVGTTCDLKNRRRMHYKKFGHLFYGLPPVMTVIDLLWSNHYWPALALERYWINHYKTQGAKLVNRRGMDDDFKVDYKAYRQEITKSNSLNYRAIPDRILEVESEGIWA